MSAPTTPLPRPVVIFARDLKEARDFAIQQGLMNKGRAWLFARSAGQLRYVIPEAVAVLPGFHENPERDTLDEWADRLEEESAPYVPQEVRS